MTGEIRKRKAPTSKNNVVDRLCRQRQIPPGTLAINNSRMAQGKTGSRNPPPPSHRTPPPTIQTTTTSLPAQPSPLIQPTQPPSKPSQPIRTNRTPPPIQTNPTSSSTQPPQLIHINPTPPPTQTNPTPQSTQAQPSNPTSEEFRFIPTPGYSPRVSQSPPHRTAHDDHQGEGGQTLPNEEQQEQDGGQRPKIYIMEDTNALSPGDVVAMIVRKVIVKLYRGTFYNYSELKAYGREKERKEWFNTFKLLVCWDRCDDAKMEVLFHQKCGKRLTDIYEKARSKVEKPPWMGEDTWTYLLEQWKSEKFKATSTQNKTNHSSSKGGAVHTTGRKAHHDVALELAKKLKRPAHPDEIFIATHKKKNGAWVDNRAETTHENYLSSLTQATQTGDDVDGETRIQIWKEVAGGKTRGRCYVVAQLARNVRHGVSYLTQSTTNPSREANNQAIEAARDEAASAREEAAQANARTAELEKQFELLRQQVFDMFQNRQEGPSSAHSNDHPDYNLSEDDECDHIDE